MDPYKPARDLEKMIAVGLSTAREIEQVMEREQCDRAQAQEIVRERMERERRPG